MATVEPSERNLRAFNAEAVHPSSALFPELSTFPQVKRYFSAVIFDYDGTLVDSMWVWEAIDERFIEEYGIVLPDDYVDVITPMTFEETARYFADRLDGKLTVGQVMERFDELALDEYARRVLCKPGVKKYLEILHERGVGIAVATSLSKILVEASMRFNGIAESFDAMAFCDESGVGKTKPRVFEMAAERLGVEPEECLVFEDLPQAIESARSIGMTACAVMEPYDHQDSELAAKVADFSIESFEQLVANAQ